MFCAWTIVYNSLSNFACAQKRYQSTFYSIRNELSGPAHTLLDEAASSVSEKTGLLEKGEPLPRWFWTMAVHSLVSNADSHRSNQINRIKKELRSRTTDEEYSVLCYLMKCRNFLSELIRKPKADLPKIRNKKVSRGLSEISEQRLHSLLMFVRRRIIQLDTHCHTESPTWMRLDKCGYRLIQEEGRTILRIPPFAKGQEPLLIELKAPFFTGRTRGPKSNIILVYDRDKNVLRVQRVVEIKVRKAERTEKRMVGADCGINCPIADSDGNVFNAKSGGKTHKELLKIFSKKEAEHLAAYQKQESKAKLREAKAREASAVVEMGVSPSAVSYFENQFWKNRRKAEKIRKNNMGKKRFNRMRRKERSRIKCLINVNAGDFLASLDSSVEKIILEALDLREAGFSREMNHMLSSWSSGYLQERIAYKALYLDIAAEEVNPAFSSQYCHECGSRIERSGKDKTVGICPVCHEIHADVNAARNLLWAYENPNIQLRTPHKKVKEEYEKRREAKSAIPFHPINPVISNAWTEQAIR